MGTREIPSTPAGNTSDARSSAGDTGYRSLLSTAFDGSRNAMALVGEDRRVVEVNDAALLALGYKIEDVIERPFDELVADSDRPAMDRAWQYLNRDGSYTGETHVLTHDGSLSWVGYAATMADTAEGRLALIVALAGPRTQGHDGSTGDRQPLSARESEVVRMLAGGHTGAAIAKELFISPLTVQTHVRNAMRKQGARTRPHLIAITLRGGLL